MNSKNNPTALKTNFSHKSSITNSMTKMISGEKGGSGKSITTAAFFKYLIECGVESFSIEFDEGSSGFAKKYLLRN